MGFEDVLDDRAFLTGEVQIDADITPRIDDRSFAIGAQEVGKVGKALCLDLFESRSVSLLFGIERV